MLNVLLDARRCSCGANTVPVRRGVGERCPPPRSAHVAKYLPTSAIVRQRNRDPTRLRARTVCSFIPSGTELRPTVDRRQERRRHRQDDELARSLEVVLRHFVGRAWHCASHERPRLPRASFRCTRRARNWNPHTPLHTFVKAGLHVARNLLCLALRHAESVCLGVPHRSARQPRTATSSAQSVQGIRRSATESSQGCCESPFVPSPRSRPMPTGRRRKQLHPPQHGGRARQRNRLQPLTLGA